MSTMKSLVIILVLCAMFYVAYTTPTDSATEQDTLNLLNQMARSQNEDAANIQDTKPAASIM